MKNPETQDMEIAIAIIALFGVISCANPAVTSAARAGKCQDYVPTCFFQGILRCDVNSDGCRTCTCTPSPGSREYQPYQDSRPPDPGR